VDRALYLPSSWAQDAERRVEAGIPEEVRFATKPELAARMLEQAFDADVPAGWVTGDSVYGGARKLRMFLEARKRPFVLAVTGDEALWTDAGRGPEQARARRLAKDLPPTAWRRLSAGTGSKGERLFDWALVPLYRLQRTPEERLWGHWLVVRRSIAAPEKLAFYVAFAPKDGTTLEGLVCVAGVDLRIIARRSCAGVSARVAARDGSLCGACRCLASSHSTRIFSIAPRSHAIPIPGSDGGTACPPAVWISRVVMARSWGMCST
jgi:SRSO17 transposase